MTKIIPAILTPNYEEIKTRAQEAEAFGLLEVQLDMCDGIFVPTTTWPYTDNDENGNFARIMDEKEGLPLWDKIDYELDLMIRDAHSHFETYLKLGAKRIIFHMEAEGELNDFKDFLEGIDMTTRDYAKIGVAIDIATPAELIWPLLLHVDFVQCMGIDHDGSQGEPFDEKVIEKIGLIRAHEGDIEISVDGGVGLKNAQALINAGANRLIVGSALWKSPNPSETIKEFLAIANK